MGIFYEKKHNQFSRKRKVSFKEEASGMKGRRWNTEEDQLLSEMVLNTISQGGTQLTAFSEVGKKIGRTAGACGFRWNAVLRGQNPTSYSAAKKKRVYTQLEKKRRAKVETFSDAIDLLKQTEQTWMKQQKELTRLTELVAKTKQQVANLQQENQVFHQEYHEVEWVQQEVKSKYEELCQLMAKLKRETSVINSATLSQNRTVGKTEFNPST
jgi:prespore-specific regulator